MFKQNSSTISPEKKPQTNKKPCLKLYLGQNSGSLYLPAHISKLPGEASKAKKRVEQLKMELDLN